MYSLQPYRTEYNIYTGCFEVDKVSVANARFYLRCTGQAGEPGMEPTKGMALQDGLEKGTKM